ncbi:MAG: hypothetical protein JWM76_1905 [Pseudonocardiales bacterium]|nr:hypothetical protein [Pseudonocardiales bacterium]
MLRGAGASDLPAERVLAGLHLPVLILAWAGDPGHPIATAEKLAGLIQGSELRVAETGAQLAQWGRLSAEFLRV